MVQSCSFMFKFTTYFAFLLTECVVVFLVMDFDEPILIQLIWGGFNAHMVGPSQCQINLIQFSFRFMRTSSSELQIRFDKSSHNVLSDISNMVWVLSIVFLLFLRLDSIFDVVHSLTLTFNCRTLSKIYLVASFLVSNRMTVHSVHCQVFFFISSARHDSCRL